MKLTMKPALVCFLFIAATSAVNNKTNISANNGTEIDNEEKIRQDWIALNDFIREAIVRGLEFLMNAASGESAKISKQCTSGFLRLALDASKMKLWAVSMIDASGKLTDGISQGSFASIGSYDQCVGIKVPERKSKPNKFVFQGKYCAVDIKPPLPPKPKYYLLNKRLSVFDKIAHRNEFMERLTNYAHMFYFMSLRFGLCVPSTCNETDILNILTALTKNVHLNVTVPRCEIKEEFEIHNYQIPSITLFVTALVGIFIATTLDIYLRINPKNSKRRGVGLSMFLCYSMYTNTMKFLDTAPAASNSLSCLNGLRFFSMTWIVLGHEYFFAEYTVLRRMWVVLGYANNFAFQVIVNATVVVDTFFFISGLLVVYVTLNVLKDTKRSFNIPIYIFHRFWRLMPLHVVIVAFTFLLPLMGSGPLWHQVIDPVVNSCKQNWWTNLLFINNIYHDGRPCLIHSWYLAADLQIYVSSLIILIPLIKWPRVGLFINAVVACTCMLASGLHTYFGDYPPTMLFAHPDPEQRLDYISEMYYMPYIHASAYCIGMAVGYVLHHYPRVKMSKRVLIIGWSMAIIFAMSSLYGVYEWNKSNLPDPVIGAIYASTHRAAWALSVAWLTFACSMGYGGFINSILSWKALIPLSRLSFTVYVIHPFIQLIYYGNFREEVNTAHYLAVFTFFGFLFGCYLSAFAVSLMIESPYLAMEKILFSRHGGTKKEITEKKEEADGDQSRKKHYRENVYGQNGSTLVFTNHDDKQSGPVTGIRYNGFPNTEPQSTCAKNGLSNNHKDISDSSYVCHL